MPFSPAAYHQSQQSHGLNATADHHEAEHVRPAATLYGQSICEPASQAVGIDSRPLPSHQLQSHEPMIASTITKDAGQDLQFRNFVETNRDIYF